MSKIINPFKIEQEENDLLKQIIELQKLNNELLQKLIKTQATDTPSELIKKYYPDARPQNKILSYTLNLTTPPSLTGTPQEPFRTNADERFPCRIWFIKVRIYTINVTDPLIAAQCGIRLFKDMQFFPEPNYPPYDQIFANRNYFSPANNIPIELEFTPPLELLPNEQYGIELFKPAQVIAWFVQLWYIREV